MNTENFRAAIRKLIRNGMSQNQLVKMSGVPQSTLSDFLSGKTKELVSRHVFSLLPIVYGKKCEVCNEAGQASENS